MKVYTHDQVNKVVLKWFKKLKSENVPDVDQRKGIIFCLRIDLRNFPSIRWMVGQIKEKVGFNFFISESFTI